MKHIVFVTILLIASIYANAQPVAGKLFVGGSLGLTLTTEKSKDGNVTVKEPSTTEIIVLPQAGYFLSDRIAVGAFLGVNSEMTKYHEGTLTKSSTTTFLVEPYARYYLISGKAGIFAEAQIDVGVGKTKAKYEAVTVETDNFEFAVGLGPGVYLYITEKLCLETKFGWAGFETQIDKSGDDSKDTWSRFGVNLHADYILFGLTFML